MILPPSSGTQSLVSLVIGALLPWPSASPPPGLALMMQLARELKTLARDLGMAVVVRKWARPACWSSLCSLGCAEMGGHGFDF